MLRAAITILAVATAFAVPSAAFAQGAGSDQYQDPLAGQPGAGNGGGGGGGGNGGGGGGNGGGNGSAPTAGTDQTTSASTGGGTTSAQAGNQLPATGADAWLLALAGASLLGGGLGLRRVAGRHI